jgi:HK97 family phage portal protein
MALADLALRAAGLRARPPAPRSTTPPPGALESPNFYGTPHQPLWPSFEGATQVELGQRNLYATRAIEKLADMISGLPFQAGNVTSRTPRPTSRMMQLLGPAPGRPNPKWSSQRLWRYEIIQYLTMGKFAMVHERDSAGRIVALWPLMAQHLVPVLAPAGSTDYFEGYRYGTRGAQGYREYNLDEVTYVYRPSQLDLRQPEAPLRLARWGIDILRLIDEFDQSFLKNGGVPAHLVVTPSFTDNPSRVAFRDQFRTKFGGARNAGKPAFAEYTDEPGDFGQGQPRQTVDVKVIGTAQKDAQMAETRQSRIDDMALAIGVPLSLLGLSRDSKYTNMDTDRQNCWRETANPLAGELADNVNTAFATTMDNPTDIGWFDTSGVAELRKPPVFTEQGGLAAVQDGTISENEYRTDRGLPPKEGGDVYRTKAAPPVIEPPAGEPQPAIPTPPAKPPVRATAVRTDLLDVVRAQLATELSAQRAELEARRDGKRGGRRRAHAALDLALVYDQDHWQRRLAINLAPGLRAAGYGDEAIESFSVDVTSAVLAQLDGQTSIPQVTWEPDGYLPALDRPAVQLDAGLVETVLAQVAGGQHDAATALALLGGGA